MTRRVSVVGDSILSIAGVLAQGLSRFAYTAIIGRALGADVLSSVNVAFAVSILLSLLWPTAAGNAAAAFLQPGARAVGRALQQQLGIVALPLAAIAALIAMFLGGGAGQAISVALLTLAWSAYIFARGARMGLGQVAAAARWDLITAVVSIGLLIVVLITDRIELLLVPAIIGYGIFAATGLIAIHRSAPVAGGLRSRVPSLFPFVVWSSLALIATNGLMQVSMVVAFAFDPPARSGQFAAALALATPISMITQAVTQALLPRFAEWDTHDPHRRGSQFRRTLLVLGIVMALGCGAVALLMPWVLPLFFGPRFVAAVPMAQLLMIAVFGFSLAITVAAYLAATSRARLATVLAGSGSLVGLAVMLSIAPAAGGVVAAISGVGIGTVVSAIALAIPAVRDTGRPGLPHALSYDLGSDSRPEREGP